MPAARPSQASVANVISAMTAAGIRIGAVRVLPDGGFLVETASVAESPAPPSDNPKWDEVAG